MNYKKHTFAVFVLPSIAFFLFVIGIPFIQGLMGSFTDWKSISHSMGQNFIGFDNYKTALHDVSYLNAFGFTIGYTILAVITTNILGLFLAFLLNKAFRGRNAIRSIFFIPNLIGGIVLGLAWKILFLVGFKSMGFDRWLTTHTNTFFALVIVTTWQNAGYMMIIFAAALQNIPKDQVEAAKISGCGRWKIFKTIIIPNLMPAITVTLFLTFQRAIKAYSLALALTSGGAHNTTVISMDIYNSAFGTTEFSVLNHFGVAQAKAVMFTIVISSIALLQIRFTKKREINA